jgi:hypothetical protein
LIKHHLLDEIDTTLAFLGLILASVLTIYLVLTIGRLIYITFGFFFFFACAGYLITKKFLVSSTQSSLDLAETSSRVYLAMNTLFFLFFTYSVLSLYLEQSLYTRPLGYFISIALMATLVAVEILFLPSRRWCTYFALFKIVLIGISLVFSQLLIFPSIVGIDPWVHQMFTLNILNSGQIPEGFGYSKLPLMHLMIGSTSLITGLNYKMATMLSVSLSQLFCNILFTFLLGYFLFDKKVGLLGGLLLGVANWNVEMGFWVIPNTMASVFIPIIIYLLLKIRREKSSNGVSLAILLMGTLILTHTVTALCMAILLFAFWAGFKVYNYMHHEWKTPVTLIMPVLFTVGMFSWWTYVSGDIGTLGELIRRGFSFDVLLRLMPKEVTQYVLNIPFSEQLFNNLGLFLFFVISFIGCLFMISKRFRNPYRFVIALGGAIIFATSSFAQIAGIGIIIERWWYFAQLMLALPLAVAFFVFCWIVKSRLGKALVLATLTFSFSFLMIMSPVANLDNPTFSPNTQVRFAFTESELIAAERASNMWNRTIGVDSYYSLLWFPSFLAEEMNSQSAEDIDIQLYNRNYTDFQDSFILIRKEIVNHPFGSGYLYKIAYDPQDVLTTQTFSKVYDCGSVSGFVNTKYHNLALP